MAGGKIQGVELAGVASAVPDRVSTVEDLEKVFGQDQARRIAQRTGVLQRHISGESICASDLCFAAAENLLQELDWDRNSVDVLVFVSATPDYVMPATACILQDRLKLGRGCAAFDITHGCSGYVYGLWVVANLLASGNARKGLLLVGDTVTRCTSPFDRTTAPLFGDAGSATALQRSESGEPMCFELGSDGDGFRNIIVKAGAFRYPSTTNTKERFERKDGNVRSDEEIDMDGAEMFAFCLKQLPVLNDKILELAGWTYADVSAVVMPQTNMFVMQHVAKKMRVPQDKLVENLVDYGDTGASMFPLAMSTKLSEKLKKESMRLVLLSYGTGLSWAASALTCGPLVIPKLTKVKPSPSD